MTAPHWDKRFLSGTFSSGTSDIYTGPLPVDQAGGFSITPGKVRVFRNTNTTTTATWGGQQWVGEDDGLGGIRGAGSFAAGDLTGNINYATGEITVQENGTDIFNSSYEFCSVEYLQEHNTLSADFVAIPGVTTSSIPAVSREVHSLLADPVVNHGTHCLALSSTASGSYGGVMWLLTDAAQLTTGAVMTEYIFRNGGINTWAALLQRVELVYLQQQGLPVSHAFYVGQMFQASSNYRLYIGMGGSPAYYGPEGSYNDSFFLPNGAISNYIAVDASWWNIWNKMRLISTVEGSDVHLNMLIAKGATEADKVNPTWSNFGDVWHVQGSTTPQRQDGDMGAIGGGSWANVRPAGVDLPGRAGFGLYHVNNAHGTKAYADSFKAFAMP